MAEDIPAHRAAIAPRSGDTVMIVGGEAKKVAEKDRKAAEAKAAESAAKSRADADKAAAKAASMDESKS